MKSKSSIFLGLSMRVALGLTLLVGLCFALGVQSRSAHAQQPTTITVSPCDESHLDSAITQATTDNAGDTINFSCGGSADITLTKTIDITASMTIDGSGQNITLDGQSQVGIFYVEPAFVNGTLTFNLQNITLANGSYTYGGGIFNYQAVNITNTTFTGNSACSDSGEYGGAIENFGNMTITNSTFANNKASIGGAIDNGQSGTLHVTNSTFYNNTAGACNSDGGYGGAIADGASASYITSSTIVDNSAPSGNGGGLAYYGGGGSINVKGSIVDNNTGGNCGSFGNVYDQGYNLESSSDCNFTNTGSLQNTDPLLDPNGLQNNSGPTQTVALQIDSPAIDQVPLSANICPATDQRGNARPDNPSESKCDMGAYETSYDDDLGLTNMPADITANATSPNGANVTYTLPTVVDPDDSSLPAVNCNPASGSLFPLGQTTVTCTVTDSDDTPSTVTKTFTVTVIEADLDLTNMPGPITKNATSTSGAVVTYKLPKVVDPDDSSLPPVNCSPASGTTFAIGQTSVTCTVTESDDGNSPVSKSFTVTINAVLTLSVPTTVQATEGAKFSYTASGKLYGTSNSLSATIDWGDGSNPTVLNVTASNGSYSAKTSHTYAEEGSYSAIVTINDSSDNLSKQKSSSVSVADAALTLHGTTTVISGKSLTLKGSFSDADPGAALADYTASINWGDSSNPSTATLSATSKATIFNYLGKHSYANHGTYNVTLTITDAGGSTITVNATVTV